MSFTISTDAGDIILAVRPDAAPVTVEHMKNLITKGLFDNTYGPGFSSFHTVCVCQPVLLFTHLTPHLTTTALLPSPTRAAGLLVRQHLVCPARVLRCLPRCYLFSPYLFFCVSRCLLPPQLLLSIRFRHPG